MGYLPPYPRSKHLRDTELGVRIEFLTTGEYPGDGKEKPVAFPAPEEVSFISGGIRYIDLPHLIELKLASGMTSPGRLKDLADVLELIKILDLPAGYADRLDPYVRGKFLELRNQSQRRYVMTWRNKWLTASAKTLDEMVASLGAAASQLDGMKADGVVLDSDGGTGDDYALLVTTDAEIARKYGMIEESEYWDRDDREEGVSTDDLPG